MKRKNFKDPFNGENGCFHLASDHLNTKRLFQSEEEFILGVNSLAILIADSDVSLIAYCLMDNHIHLLLSGRLKDCLAFYDKAVHRIVLLLDRVEGKTGILREEDVDITPVQSERQFKNEICYIHRNPYKARIAAPSSYEWSSADVYFSPRLPTGTSAGGLNARRQRSIFHTHQTVPDHYEYDGRGLILNKGFVSFKKGEARFRDSVEYFDLLRKYALEAEVESAAGIHESIVFSDMDLMAKARAICQSEMHASSIQALGRKELLLMARKLSSRFGAAPGQISRLLGVEKEILERYL